MPTTFVSGETVPGPRRMRVEVTDLYLAADGPVEEDGRRFDLVAIHELDEIRPAHGASPVRWGDPIWIVAKLSTPSPLCQPWLAGATVASRSLPPEHLAAHAFEPVPGGGASIRFEWRRHGGDAAALARFGFWRARWVPDDDLDRVRRVASALSVSNAPPSEPRALKGTPVRRGDAAHARALREEGRELQRVAARAAERLATFARTRPSARESPGGRSLLVAWLAAALGEDPLREDGPGCPHAADGPHRNACAFSDAERAGPLGPRCLVCGTPRDPTPPAAGLFPLLLRALERSAPGAGWKHVLLTALVREWLSRVAGEPLPDSAASDGSGNDRTRQRVEAALRGEVAPFDEEAAGPVAVRIGVFAVAPRTPAGDPARIVPLAGTEAWSRPAALEPPAVAGEAVAAVLRAVRAAGVDARALVNGAGASFLKLPVRLLAAEIGLMRSFRRGLPGRLHPYADGRYPWADVLARAAVRASAPEGASLRDRVESLGTPGRRALEEALRALARPPLPRALPDEPPRGVTVAVVPAAVAMVQGLPATVDELLSLSGFDLQIAVEAVRATGGPDLVGAPEHGSRTDVAFVLDAHARTPVVRGPHDDTDGSPFEGLPPDLPHPALLVEPGEPLLGFAAGPVEAAPLQDAQDAVRGALGIVGLSFDPGEQVGRTIRFTIDVDTVSDAGPTAAAVLDRVRGVTDALGPHRVAVRLRPASYARDVLGLPPDLLAAFGLGAPPAVSDWLAAGLGGSAHAALRDHLAYLRAAGSAVLTQ